MSARGGGSSTSRHSPFAAGCPVVSVAVVSAAVGGAFTGMNGYSSQYQNAYFFGDYARDEISVLKVDGSNNLIPGSLAVFTSAADGPVQFEIGPEGDVYYLSIFTGEIRRIRYVGDNRPPVAQASATPMAGLAPLNVTFSSAGSNDPDAGQAITYFWDFGDGSTSVAANPSHQYTTNGNKTVTAGGGGMVLTDDEAAALSPLLSPIRSSLPIPRHS